MTTRGTPNTATLNLTKAARLERRRYVERLVHAGFGMQQCRDAMREKYQASRMQSDRLYLRALGKGSEDFETERAHLKSQQANRIRGYIAKAAAKEKWGNVASLEKVYADVVGTNAPVRVQVDETIVRLDATRRAMNGMTQEEMDVALHQQLELEAAAELAFQHGLVRRLPGKDGSS